VNFNVQNNPFQGSYLFNYSLQGSNNTGSSPANPNGQNPPSINGPTEYQTFLDEQLRARNANEQRKKKDVQSQPQQQNMQEMMQQLSTKKQEVGRLQHQLDSTNDPALQRLLQNKFGTTSQTYSDLENQVSLMFRGPGSGFVGSEGRIDHVGGFVTTS